MTMPFADTTQNFKSGSSDRRKVKYLNLDSGTRQIRFLQETAKRFDTHYINRATVQCLGEDCPICANNRKLAIEFSEDKEFRKQKTWNPSRPQFYVNVLDRTKVKVCPGCGKEIYKVGRDFPATCSDCNNYLTDVEVKPSNQVKVLQRGKRFADYINSSMMTVLDENEDPIPLTTYDYILSISGVGQDKDVVPTSKESINDPVNFKEEDLFDLNEIVIKLEPDEMLDLQRGVSLRDIFSARRNSAVEDKTEKPIETTAKLTNEELQKKIKELYGE
jgi:hypothetical protein